MGARVCGVYKITNTVNCKLYIGSSVEIGKRICQHKADLRNNNHHSKHLQNAWNKYGENMFKFEIVEVHEDGRDSLREREQWYIDQLNSCDRNIGYNINNFASGGGLFGENNPMFNNSHLIAGDKNGFFGKRHSVDTKRTISEKNSGTNSPWYGRKHTAEQILKISESHKGIKFTEEHIRNMSISRIGKRTKKNGLWKGGITTKEGRERQKDACSISVVMIGEDGLCTMKFKSVTEAGNYLGIGSENISRACKGKIKTAGGYKWMYQTEYPATKHPLVGAFVMPKM